jgi:Uma2 family endonuclease
VGLVVEVESRHSRRHDRFTKPALYAEAGIEYYWRVERTSNGPEVHLYETAVSANYVLMRSVKAGERHEVALPYPMVVEPAAWMMPIG